MPRPINIAILGSTGSIGRQTLEIVASLPDRFKVLALAAGSNRDLLLHQVVRFQPQVVHLEQGGEGLPDVATATPEEIACHPEVDVLLVGTTGKAGLLPALAALKAGKAVALANKEALVMAGGILTQAAKRYGGQLRPVDSEHSAIWQCLWGEDHKSIRRLVLTASGGAFRDFSVDELAHVTPEQALRHPTWDMGPKITIDSATLFNKGLETIEARWLFDVPLDRVGVVQHRESIVHSLVEFSDGSVKAQLGLPDMRLPILLALTYPERAAEPQTATLDLAAVGQLNFGSIDHQRFPLLQMAIEAGQRGGTYPAVLAAADEIAVQQFLDTRIGFREIASAVESVLSDHDGIADPELEDILAADEWARRRAADWITARA
ncbi:MAG TPA: 1-deoxy-D-xylulose-5-phosphate reductoisomerase [Dehalococcoidia bacterium]|nr:1-deoxy-D-xylulose-5-phosphate reductoisomerase [Dehalococcoidia bacterium]